MLTVSVESLEKLAQRLDAHWRIPGTNIRMGWDSLLGLLPVIGDTAPLLFSIYIIWGASKLGASRWVQLRMGWNVFLDWLIGMIPLLGDLFDIGFKANLRNIALLKKHMK